MSEWTREHDRIIAERCEHANQMLYPVVGRAVMRNINEGTSNG